MSNLLIETLQQARANEGNADGAFTMNDLARETGRSPHVLRRELWELRDAGLLEVLRVKKQRIDGVWTGTVAYRIVETDEHPTE